MVATTVTGDGVTAARLLMPEFFKLLAQGHPTEARAVLDEMKKLVPTDPSAHVDSVFPRLYNEKRAYSFLVEGNYPDAVRYYRLALEGTLPADLRGHLKVGGGLALAECLRDGSATAITTFKGDMEQLQRDAATSGFKDVADAAAENVSWADGTAETWAPFETV